MDFITTKIFDAPNDVLAIGIDGAVLTKGEAAEQAHRLARGLAAQGLSIGSAVIVRIEPFSFKRVIAEVACLIAGYPYMAEFYHDADGYIDTIKDAFGAFNLDETAYDALMASDNYAPLTAFPTETETAMFVRSSGTTGPLGRLPDQTPFKHKFIRSSREQAIAKRLVHAENDGYATNDRVLQLGSGTACYYPESIVGTLIGVQGALVLHDIMNSYHADDLALRTISLINAVYPTVIKQNFPKSPDLLARHVGHMLHTVRDADLSATRRYYYSCNPPRDTAERMQAFAPSTALAKGYGSSEMLGPLSCRSEEPVEKRLFTVGRDRIVAGHVRIAASGELEVSPQYHHSYAHEAGSAHSARWHKTGDRFTQDADGYIDFVGRIGE